VAFLPQHFPIQAVSWAKLAGAPNQCHDAAFGAPQIMNGG
jgi:hypothetical protein